MNNNALWKYVLTGMVTVCMIAMLTACSASEEGSADGQVASSQAEEQTGEIEHIDVQETVEDEAVVTTEGEAETIAESTEAGIEESAEDTAEQTVEASTLEEPQIEMVDFETWAKQEDNDEVCVVVWNEELGVQEIMPTIMESKKTYLIQEGDRFAIPYNERIMSISINDEKKIFENSDYLEVILVGGEHTILDVIYIDENEEHILLEYSFK